MTKGTASAMDAVDMKVNPMNYKLAVRLALTVSLIVVAGSAFGFVLALDMPQTRKGVT